ncbi:MAG: type I-C CRISPR-associated endonuclease Cas1 [Lentisphaeria bacterium]|nr:type I-C CRISPR-associated endonuclease Cas1 [Lentisphaeria bacterium]
MRKLLNTLYVSTPGAYLSKEGMAIQIARPEMPPVRLPAINLAGIVCFGRVSCSPYLMNYCAENSILISFLDEHGRFLARVEGPVSGNVLLRKEQYRIADDPGRNALAVKTLLLGKLANSRAVLRRFLRDHDPENAAVAGAADGIRELMRQLTNETSVEIMRGLEGKAADLYFSVFDALVLQQKDAFPFTSRSRRPPRDRINAMLSFVYVLLTHEVIAGLEAVGLDPASGFLHCDRPGRPSLALDLVEELRAPVADRFVLSLINNRRISKGDFSEFENGAVYLNDAGRKVVLDAWQQRKREVITHPFIGERIPLGLLFFVQARLFAKFVRGEEDAYASFIWK